MNPRSILEAGAEILGEYLYPIGFHFEITREGRGSGGEFAQGEFKIMKSDWSCTFETRWE